MALRTAAVVPFPIPSTVIFARARASVSVSFSRPPSTFSLFITLSTLALGLIISVMVPAGVLPMEPTSAHTISTVPTPLLSSVTLPIVS